MKLLFGGTTIVQIQQIVSQKCKFIKDPNYRCLKGNRTNSTTSLPELQIQQGKNSQKLTTDSAAAQSQLFLLSISQECREMLRFLK
jgi:hypothetical protein